MQQHQSPIAVTHWGSWKRRIQSDADTGIFKKHFYIYITSYFSYLTLFLLQSLLPDPGVDPFSACPFISARAKD